MSPGAGDADPDLTLKSSSSEKSAEEDMEQCREGFPELELCETKENEDKEKMLHHTRTLNQHKARLNPVFPLTIAG